VEYYHKNGLDMIGHSPLDPTTGLTTFKGNVANINGNGVDVTLHADLFKAKFGWKISALYSYAADKVTRYFETTSSNYLADGSVDRAAQSINPVEGRPVFGIYSYRWAGLDPATGDPLGYTKDGTVSKDYTILARSLRLDDYVFNGPA